MYIWRSDFSEEAKGSKVSKIVFFNELQMVSNLFSFWLKEARDDEEGYRIYVESTVEEEKK